MKRLPPPRPCLSRAGQAGSGPTSGQRGIHGTLHWRRPAFIGVVLAGVLLLQGCSASLDWRLTRLPGWGLEAALPCRPAQQQRTVTIAGVQTTLHLAVCTVQNHTFAVSRADLAKPEQVDLVLRALAQAAQANLQGQVQQDTAAQVLGMTPQAAARHLRLVGQRADGQPMQMAVWLFARGLRVYQATVVGPRLNDEDWAPLAESLKLAPP